MNRLRFVDALRGYAIFGVIMVHTGLGLPYDWANKISWEGARGVQLFYIASAFTMFYTLDQRTGKETQLYLKFLIRRFFRIVPLYYLAIVTYLAIEGFSSINTLGNILAHAFFYNGFSPYYINTLVPGGWSIAIEMTFYLLVPFIHTKIKNLRASILLFLCSMPISFILIYVLLRLQLISDSTLWHAFLFFWLPTQFPVFCLGFVLYFLLKDKLKQPNERNNMRFSYVLLAISIISIFVLIFIPRFINEVAFIYPFGIALLIFGLSLSYYNSKLFVNAFWTYLGKISFSAYLCHFAVIPIANKIALNLSFIPASLFIFTLLLTIVVSTITYHIIEKPFIRLGSKIISKLEFRNNLFAETNLQVAVTTIQDSPTLKGK